MITPSSPESAFGALEAELFREKMASLADAGGKAQAALAMLAASTDDPASAAHQALLDRAAGAVWAFIVQRELCGLPGSAQAIRDLDVPPAVTARLGIVRRA